MGADVRETALHCTCRVRASNAPSCRSTHLGSSQHRASRENLARCAVVRRRADLFVPDVDKALVWGTVASAAWMQEGDHQASWCLAQRQRHQRHQLARTARDASLGAPASSATPVQ